MVMADYAEGKLDALKTKEQFTSPIEVASAIGEFDGDPPDDDYQQGYLDGLWEVLDELRGKK